MKGLFLLLLAFHSVTSNWWYTSQFDNTSFANAPRNLCSLLPGLSRRQRQICVRTPALMVTVGAGVRQGIAECQHQFQFHRWNCTTFPHDFSLFGRELVRGGTREVAFIEAITVAAATWTLARECARGYPYCSCALENWSQFQAHRFAQNAHFKWRGCDEDLKFGTSFVRRLSDAQEHNSRDVKALTSRHNNRVGRTILKKSAAKQCKCHGLSGSCSLRTCWKSITNLRSLGRQLREKYDAAILVTFNPGGRAVTVTPGQRAPRRTDLMFYEQSADLCKPNRARGILGTQQRPCKLGDGGEGYAAGEEESCDILCCGQTYNVVRVQSTTKCNCQFHWCCQVKCDTCNVTRKQAFCT